MRYLPLPSSSTATLGYLQHSPQRRLLLKHSTLCFHHHPLSKANAPAGIEGWPCRGRPRSYAVRLVLQHKWSFRQQVASRILRPLRLPCRERRSVHFTIAIECQRGVVRGLPALHTMSQQTRPEELQVALVLPRSVLVPWSQRADHCRVRSSSLSSKTCPIAQPQFRMAATLSVCTPTGRRQTSDHFLRTVTIL